MKKIDSLTLYLVSLTVIIYDVVVKEDGQARWTNHQCH